MSDDDTAPGPLPECSLLPVRGASDDDQGTVAVEPVLRDMRPSDPHAAAYAEMLCRRSWHWFATLTFRPSHEGRSGGMHPEKADKAFRVLVSKINRHLYGTRWYKRPETQLCWARGQEFHKSGRIHFHALLADPTKDLNDLTRRMDWVDWWYREFGIARIEAPESQEHVARYVSKYVVKDGEIDFSPNFDRVVPPELQFRNVSPPRRTSSTRAPDGDAMRTSGSRKGGVLVPLRCLTPPLRPEFAIHHQSITKKEEQPEEA